jgi:hypothetical protein
VLKNVGVRVPLPAHGLDLAEIVDLGHASSRGDAAKGVGTISNAGRVRWGVASRILWAWLLTIPASATIAAITYFIARPRRLSVPARLRMQ